MDIHKNGFEIECEFWPVEHPIEPMDEDRPVKCPMPDSSLINGNKVHKQGMYESLRKRAELSKIVSRVGMTAEPPVEAVRKRHHTLSHGDNFISPSIRIPPPPPPYNRPPQPTFPMFNQRLNSMFEH